MTETVARPQPPALCSSLSPVSPRSHAVLEALDHLLLDGAIQVNETGAVSGNTNDQVFMIPRPADGLAERFDGEAVDLNLESAEREVGL